MAASQNEACPRVSRSVRRVSRRKAVRYAAGSRTSPSAALTDPLQESFSIGPYEQSPAACNDHDPRTFDVAKRIGHLIESHLPGTVVEHVGSTSVPGCAGKGIVDLMILYPPGRLTEVRDGLDALGFQRQTGRDPFPEERPMRVGSIESDGTRFRLHAHVIAVDSPEVSELRTFRDRLRDDPMLMEQYVALKRRIITEGVTDSLDYSIRKGEFIAANLRSFLIRCYRRSRSRTTLGEIQPCPTNACAFYSTRFEPRPSAS